MGPQTWGALVEAGYSLGDRLLYQTQPMLRGDDVAELQRRLSALGFDTGRVDGIFGPSTARALTEFQRNLGLPPDGICGRRTLAELRRVMPRHQDTRLVTSVRDKEMLRRAPRTLRGMTVAIGEEGGLDALVSALRRRLNTLGARGLHLLHPDESQQAAMANAARADVFIGLKVLPTGSTSRVAFYSGYRYESSGGKLLARYMACEIASVLEKEPAVAGMSIPALRETRMTAVLCEIASAGHVVTSTAALASAMASALVSWRTSPVDSPHES